MILRKAVRETAPEFFMKYSTQDAWTFSVLFGFFSLGHKRREAVYFMVGRVCSEERWCSESLLEMGPGMQSLTNRKTKP